MAALNHVTSFSNYWSRDWWKLGMLLWLACTVANQITAEEKPQPLLLANFAALNEVKSHAAGVATRVVEREQAKSLEITVNAAHDWPGVQFQSPSGKWDLREFDAVSVQIANLQAKPIRVMLSINNPGADGRKHCNTEALEVPPRGKGTLLVPFGMWYGDPNHPLDQAEIVSVRLFLDHPAQGQQIIIDQLQALCFDNSRSEELLASPFMRNLQPPFRRGMNLGNALEAPREGEWGVTLEESYFEQIAAAGFDTIRLPVRWSAHAEAKAPYKIDEAFFQRVDWAVEQALSRKLKLVLNVHHYDELLINLEQHRPRLLALWEQIAARYQDRSPNLAFEIYNEPHLPLTAEQWNPLAAEILAVIRRTNPTRTIVVGPVSWNAISALPSLVLPERDRNIVVTYHYYDPYVFTHQGASFATAEARQTHNRPWQGTKLEQWAVRRSFDAALEWSVQHERPLFMGEFGVYEKADMESRVRWTRFLAEEAAKRKIGYAYWEFCSGFGAFDKQQNRWKEPLKAALLSAE
jgi:aryl-phospho-beta-D-glucosidase BglC (GH1 family)